MSEFRVGSRTWEYRVIRYTDPRAESGYYYAIHEVHWSGGKIIAVSSEASPLAGENLQFVMEKFQDAIKKPVIEASEIENISGTVTNDFWRNI